MNSEARLTRRRTSSERRGCFGRIRRVFAQQESKSILMTRLSAFVRAFWAPRRVQPKASPSRCQQLLVVWSPSKSQVGPGRRDPGSTRKGRVPGGPDEITCSLTNVRYLATMLLVDGKTVNFQSCFHILRDTSSHVLDGGKVGRVANLSLCRWQCWVLFVQTPWIPHQVLLVPSSSRCQ